MYLRKLGELEILRGKMVNENEDFAKEIINNILDNAEKLNVAWHWGEESLLVRDVIKLVLEAADIKIHLKCFLCGEHYSRFPKHEHGEHCFGSEKICSKFNCNLDQ